jgi:orotate phosphoribosyltransferase
MKQLKLFKEEEEEIKKLYEKHKSIITGSHFVYTPKDGRWFHGYDYVSKELLGRTSEVGNRVAEIIATHYFMAALRIDTVTGPELGIFFFIPLIRDYLTDLYKEDIISVPCEKKDKNYPNAPFYFKGIYEPDIRGKRVLVVEDVLTSGGSAKRVVEAVKVLDGQVVGLAALCNRGRVTAEAVGGVPIFSLLDVEMEMFPEEECPICKEKGPDSVRTDLGKGAEWLRMKAVK